jgi:hypothetical protein
MEFTSKTSQTKRRQRFQEKKTRGHFVNLTLDQLANYSVTSTGEREG